MLTIIGCGNLNRCDDAIGAIIAQKLQKKLQKKFLSRINIFDCGTSGMEVMFQAKGSQKLIIIDAFSINSSPGTIYKVPGEELEELPEINNSLHDFRWDNALAVGKKIFKKEFPEDVTVYLIQVKDLSFGLEISSILQPAVKKVTEHIEEEIRHFVFKQKNKTINK